MNWLARLKNQNGPEPHPTKPTKPTKPGFVGFVVPFSGHTQKFDEAAQPAVDDTASDPGRWCWPHSSAMNTGEIDCMVSRVELFVSRGLNLVEAAALADKMLKRDREGDDRRMCVECSHLSGGTGRRCSAWRPAGLGGQAIPAEWPTLPQRCPAFTANTNTNTNKAPA